MADPTRATKNLPDPTWVKIFDPDPSLPARPPPPPFRGKYLMSLWGIQYFRAWWYGLPLRGWVQGPQKVCTHQFRSTGQFLLGFVVCKRPQSLTFA